ncbi:MAG: hypothetical protein JKY82_10205 [Rhizobiaceae bacterium]|nr:hypothetical protein [Rhizobiaceae bacterium]
MSTVIEARFRQFGISSDEAKNPMMGHVFGRKTLARHFGNIDLEATRLRYEAGVNFALEYCYYRSLMGYSLGLTIQT